MKQFFFLILVTLIGTVGAFAVSPFWGIAVYYLFAVLRPQYVWDWALLDYDPQNKIRWSFYVAVGGRSVWVIVAKSAYGNKYLKTEADGEQPNNLLSLPECP